MKRLLDKYKTIKNQRQFLKMMYANCINRFGDSVDMIAFVWLVYELTHSATWSTIIFGANMLPTILVQPFAGALVEKMRKQKVMAYCDIARGLMVSIIAIFYLMGILTPWLLLITMLMNSSFEALRVPAGIAIVPHLLEEDHYDTGIALNASLSRGMELVGTGCAGLIIAVMGIAGAIFIDAFTFAMSAVFIASIKYEEQIKKTKITVSSYLLTLKEGIHYIKNKQIVVVICLIAAFMNMMLVPINSFMPIYIDTILKGGSEMLSLLSIGITVGSMIGSFFYPMLIKRWTKRKLLLATNAYVSLFYFVTILIPMTFDLPLLVLDIVIFLLYLGIGIFSAAASTFVSVLLTSRVDRAYLARVGAVFGAFASLMIPIGSLIATILLQFFNFMEITLMFAGVSTVLFVVYTMHKSFYLLDEE